MCLNIYPNSVMLSKDHLFMLLRRASSYNVLREHDYFGTYVGFPYISSDRLNYYHTPINWRPMLSLI